MSLSKVTYVDGETVIYAQNLNDIQDAIIAVESGKQNVLTFDNVPTPESSNPVKSGGVYSVIASVMSTLGIKKASITLNTSGWSGDGPYTKVLTISGYTVTANTKVDLTCSQEVMAALRDMGIESIYVENNSGTLTVYVVGASLASEVTLDCVIYETSAI